MLRRLLMCVPMCLPMMAACGTTPGRAPVVSDAHETAQPAPEMALSEPADTAFARVCDALREEHDCPPCECTPAGDHRIRLGAARPDGTWWEVEVDGTETVADDETANDEDPETDADEPDVGRSDTGESGYEKQRNPRPFTWRAWGKHAVTGERIDVLRRLPGRDRDGMVPLDGYLTIELELLEGPPPPLVVIRVNAKDSRYRQRSRAFRGSAFRVGVPVRWRVSVGAVMQLELECPHGGCRSAMIFPLWVKPKH